MWDRAIVSLMTPRPDALQSERCCVERCGNAANEDPKKILRPLVERRVSVMDTPVRFPLGVLTLTDLKPKG